MFEKRMSEFHSYLRELYSQPDSTMGDGGGFLVPEQIIRNKPGVVAKACRFFGELIFSPAIHRKGVEVFNLRERLLEHAKNLGITRGVGAIKVDFPMDEESVAQMKEAWLAYYPGNVIGIDFGYEEDDADQL